MAHFPLVATKAVPGPFSFEAVAAAVALARSSPAIAFRAHHALSSY